MGDNRFEYYSSGYYLHRLYLTDNPLIKEYSTDSQVNKAKELLESMVNNLRKKEDVALAHLAEAFYGPENATAEKGIRFLKTFVSAEGDGRKLLNDIMSAFINTPKDSETNRYLFNDEKQQKRLIQSTIDALANRLDNNNNEFKKAISGWKDTLEKSLREIKFTNSQFIQGRPAAALEGEFFERVVPEYFNLKFKEVMLKNEEKFNKYINLDAEFTGQGDLQNAIINLGRKNPFDVNITFSYKEVVDEFPMQIKTKPMSYDTDINLYANMYLVNFINNALDEAQRKALQTAIINQHYWSQGSYRNKVEEVAEKAKYNLGFRGRGHPTAIERLDKNSTIEPLKEVIPLMRYAIMYNLITGVDNVTDQLVYIIVGKESNSTVLRSSEIIEKIIENVFGISISGHGVSKKEKIKSSGETIKVPNFVDDSVYDDYDSSSRRSDWYNKTRPKMEGLLNKVKITATLNYSLNK